MSLTLSLDFEYKTSIKKLWSALTDSDKLAQWILSNDFKPIVGHQFQFRSEPNEWWNGIIDCKVLIVDEPNRLSYTWASGDEQNTVTWTLQDLGNGTVKLHFEQTGISNKQALGGARGGWIGMHDELKKLVE